MQTCGNRPTVATFGHAPRVSATGQSIAEDPVPSFMADTPAFRRCRPLRNRSITLKPGAESLNMHRNSLPPT